MDNTIVAVKVKSIESREKVVQPQHRSLMGFESTAVDSHYQLGMTVFSLHFSDLIYDLRMDSSLTIITIIVTMATTIAYSGFK